MGYNVCKLEPKSKSHQFAGFLDGLPKYCCRYLYLDMDMANIELRSSDV